MAEPEKKSSGTNIWPWALVTGLAVGFLVGREVGPRSPSAERAGDERPAAAAAPSGGAAPSAAVPGKVYNSEAEFPSGWLKSAEFTSVSGLDMGGMTDAQKAIAFQALNERNCECGCGKGTIAHCVKSDPGCPKSPQLMKTAVKLAKEGKTLAQVLGQLDIDNPKKAAAPSAPQQPQATARKVAIPAHAPRKGPKNAKVTIVEFSDFQCPFCSRVVPTLKEIEQKYGKDVAVVFVNQPLSFHAQARPAAKAFLAADKQGKGWEMHDKLFANQQALMPADLERYANELKLNMARFKKDMEDPATEKMVADDQTLAGSVGADGTPTFFINGRELSGAQPFASFAAVIDEEIKKADELLKKGTKADQLYDKLVEQNVANAQANAAAPPPPPAKVDIKVGDAPTKGPAKAPVTIIEFSEFQCPFCTRAVPTLKQIEKEYGNKVRIAFKHLPLPFHNNAQIAAEASMAAHEQGKFWEFHDKLFENQQQLDRASLEKYAQELNLNVGKFKAALDSGKYKKHVEEDAKVAGSVGATGTPTFFINGKILVGAQPFDEFKKVIDAELAAAK